MDGQSVNGQQGDVGAASTRSAPMAEKKRIVSIDVLRGFALLGILVMNIPWFSLSALSWFDPTISGGAFEGANKWTWITNHALFEMKMMSIFSMLFGAGVIIFTSKIEAKGRSAMGLHYRRTLWLLVFGLVHSYGIWFGDILFAYAVCGFLIYPLRKLRPLWLIIIASFLMSMFIPVNAGMGLFFEYARGQATLHDQAVDAGEEPSDLQVEMKEAWEEIAADFYPTEETSAEERELYTDGSYGEIFIARIPDNIFMQTMGLFMWGLWRGGGMMLLGMALYKMGVFSATLSMSRYVMLMGVGFIVGVPISTYGAFDQISHGFDVPYSFYAGLMWNYVGSIATALGWVGLVMVVFKLGVLTWLTSALAAVGRMALTNYLMHSIICTTFFYSYGLGMWGKFERFELWGVVLAIWAFQLIVSPIWLKYFLFGPAEWLWRTLTYMSLQPLLRRTPEATAGGAS